MNMKLIFSVLLFGFLSTGCVLSTTSDLTGNTYDYDVLANEVTINDVLTIEVPR